MGTSRRLVVEELEARTAPAAFGIPWQDARHLTLSFAPDGTPISGHQSNLFRALGPQFPTPADWQAVIVAAFQTWAINANISVGLTADSGAPFGVAGPSQGDPRFGDIRIGAQVMSPDVLAIAVPPDPFLSGTLAGDVFLNSAVAFNASNLFPVMLHEAGHVFGLDDNEDPHSVMYEHYSQQTQLASEDIQAIQALYGRRAPDSYDPNHDFADAAPIPYSGPGPLYDLTTPLVVYGDITTPHETDFFALQPTSNYVGSATFRLETAGISFLPPRLTVYDGLHRPLGQAQSTSVFGDVVTVTLPQLDPFDTYYVEVDSPASDAFGIGRYALAVTFDDTVATAYLDALDAVMRGPYDLLENPQDLADLFHIPALVYFNNDFHTNDTFATATPLESRPGFGPDTQYEMVESLIDSVDADFYRVRSPSDGGVLTATLLEMDVNGVLPVVSLYDADQNPVAADVLLNGNGTYTLQAANLLPGQDYFLQVVANPRAAKQVGNYHLIARFGDVTADLETFASGTLPVVPAEDAYTVYVARSQLFQFVLSAGDPGATGDGQVTMTIYDGEGRSLFSLTSDAGDTVSDSSILLTPGEYLVTFTADGPSGGGPLAYLLRGTNLSDPIGVPLEDSLFHPMYLQDGAPGLYSYPGGLVSDSPYLWVYEPSTGGKTSPPPLQPPPSGTGTAPNYLLGTGLASKGPGSATERGQTDPTAAEAELGASALVAVPMDDETAPWQTASIPSPRHYSTH